ncbi:MAG: sugar ABC transporter ATP-binding protein [Kosmotogaceae bacterium]
MSSTVLEMKNISKSFGGIRALKEVDFLLNEGEVHALLGENGAGKSTLVKILTGVYKKDDGQIFIDGKENVILNPLDARYKGIAAIYQELSLIENLSVAENIYLGHEPSGKILGTIRKKELINSSVDYLKSFNIEIDPKTKVSQLGMGEKRIIEIIKALSINAKILLLDEPTTGMSSAEIEIFFKILEDLKKKEVNMIYISHYLDEVFRICDRATVLRDGENAGTFTVNEVNTGTLVNAMLGHTIKDEFPKRKKQYDGEIIMSVDNFKAEQMQEPISFSLKKGEILGITGIIGSGKSELALGLFGATKSIQGSIKINNSTITRNNPKNAKINGIAFIPEDRKEQGLFPNFSLEDNIILPNIDLVTRLTLILNKAKRQLAFSTAKKLKVTPLNLQMKAHNFSGGNQQKIVVGKWLSGKPDIVILDEPTRGIDVGAKTEIYNLINEMADSGTSIILISSEFKEIGGICDRVLILRKGRVIKEMDSYEIHTEDIMSYALGGKS